MSSIFMVFHWPEPGRAEAVADGMREMVVLLQETPGCVSVEPPYVAEDGACLVGISKWDRRKRSGLPGSRSAPRTRSSKERRDRERFFLREA